MREARKVKERENNNGERKWSEMRESKRKKGGKDHETSRGMFLVDIGE